MLAEVPPSIDPSHPHDAFISYRRTDGSRHARKLRRRLLDFKVPAHLKGPNAPGKLDVYLDTIYEKADEDFFRDTIQPALDASRLLIVVQTPSILLPRSNGQANWLVREVEYYRSKKPAGPVAVGLAKGGFDDPLPADLHAHFANLERVDIRRITSFKVIRTDELILPFIARLYNVPREKMPELRREEARRRSVRLAAWAVAATVIIVSLTGLLGWALWEQAECRNSAVEARAAAGRERIAANQAREAANKETAARELAEQRRQAAEAAQKAAEHQRQEAERERNNAIGRQTAARVRPYLSG